MDKMLFSLGVDSKGPYLTTHVFDTNEEVVIDVEKNVCTFCSNLFVVQKNNRSHVLIKDAKGEILLESRVLDKKTILVSGIFSFRNFVLVATQNYLILPSGKWMMHNKTSAQNGSVLITDTGIMPVQ